MTAFKAWGVVAAGLCLLCVAARVEIGCSGRESDGQIRGGRPFFLQAPQRQDGHTVACRWPSDPVRRIPVRTSHGEWLGYSSCNGDEVAFCAPISPGEWFGD